MTVRNLSSALFFVLVSFALNAQDAAPTGTYRSFSPADQWELGVDLGLPFIVGDVDAKFPGIGGGLHVRKSLDHIFSLRFGANYFKTKEAVKSLGVCVVFPYFQITFGRAHFLEKRKRMG